MPAQNLSQIDKISTVTRPEFTLVDMVDKIDVKPVAKLDTYSFNLSQALSGVSIGFTQNGKIVPVLGFRKSGINRVEQEYMGTVDGVVYYFNKLGGCDDKNPDHALKMLNAEIPIKRDTVASRGDSDTSTENINISSLQPREQFAMAAMQSIISKLAMEDILLLDGYKITQVTTLAFNIANSMMNLSAEYRAETKQNENPPTEIEVDETTLSSASEKIMFNINSNIKSLTEELKKFNLEFKANEDKTKKVNITNTTAIETKVTNTPSVNVNNTPSVNINGTPNVNCTNMITEPVSVTGTVNVGNTVSVKGEVSVTEKTS